MTPRRSMVGGALGIAFFAFLVFGPHRPAGDRDVAKKTASASATATVQPVETLKKLTVTGKAVDFGRIEAFASWTERYLQAPAAEKLALEAEGRRLVEERRPEMKKLIVSDPERALERSVSRVARQQLPAEIVAQLEQPVSGRGAYNVYNGRPDAGTVIADGSELTLRYFEAGGKSYRARVFGAMVPVLSKKDVALRGMSIDRELAVAESPVRSLEVGEVIPAGTTVETICPVSGNDTSLAAEDEDPVSEDTPTIEVESRIIRLCNGSHVQVIDEVYRQASTTNDPAMQASGGPGGAGFYKDNYPGTSSEAIGNFRALYIRVTYPDQMRAPNTEAGAYDDMKNVSRYFNEESFGRMTVTTVVTPLIVMPHTKEWYIAKDSEVDGLGLVHSDARSEARRLGYDSNQFNVTIVRVNGGPRLSGVSWGGGDSVWVSWDGMDVINHEAGHSLGRNHANFWDTGGQSAIGDGGNQEYGNSFDVMGGGGGFAAHYNTVSKRQLGWLPDSNVHIPTASGTFRVHAYDQDVLEEGKRYCLRVQKDSRRFYHLEYHYNYGVEHTSRTRLKNAALVIWNWSDIGNAGHLIDTTPGTPDGKTDGGIELGRTFSDTQSGLHFTVIAKDDTVTPPWLDIVTQMGDFPGNQAPAVAVAASSTSAATNTPITFTATATDPNGDALAYHWDCGDDYFSENTAAFTRTFPTAGLYTMACTVSDMKGKTTRRTVVVNIGGATNRLVSGSVKNGGVGVPDVLIADDASHYTYTDADGNYTLSGVSAGSHTVSALLYGYTFTPSFTNPLNVVNGVNTANFTAGAVPVVTLAATGNATEGGASGSFTLTRTGDVSAALTVSIVRPGGTATRPTDANPDYAFNPAYVDSGSYRTFTIPAGSASLVISVDPVNDTTQEGPETVQLSLTEGAGYVTGGAANVTVIINDNDTTLPRVSIVADDAEASESAGNPGVFTVSRTGATTASLNVTVAYSGTATRGSDYPNLSTTVTIPAGQSSAALNLVPTNDPAAEGSETVTVTISAGAAYVIDPTATAASVLVLDDDIPVVSIAAVKATATEAGREPGIFLISRTGSTAAALKVYYGVSGTALHGTDYIALPTEIAIPAGQSGVPVLITPYDDSHGEGSESVIMRLTVFNGSYLVGEQEDATVTISDNADPPLVTVSAFSSTIGEPADTGTFRFHLSGSGTGSTVVKYTVSGTATSGTDFTALSGTATIPAPSGGAVDFDVTVTPIDDAVVENVETITVTITPDPAYVAYNDATATMWLRDNDAPTVNVTRHSTTPAEASTVKASSFYIGRTDAAAASVTTGALAVAYTVSGTATSGVDYLALSGVATIPDGAAGVDVTVTPINDALVEGAETVTLTLNPSASYSIGVGTDTLVITDDEAEPTDSAILSVGFGTTAYTFNEAPDGTTGAYRSVPVTLSAASTNTVTVEYIASSGTSAIADGVDWTFVDADNANAPIVKGVLSFPPGTTTLNVKLAIVNDGVVEGSETAVLELRNARFARLSSSRNLTTVTIEDNLAANPVPRAAFIQAGVSIPENGGASSLMVALDQPATVASTVSYAVTGGNATAGSDFTLTAGSLSFAIGESVKWIPLTIVNDALAEADETVIVTLSSPTGATLGTQSAQTVTIVDDDTPTVSLTVSDAIAYEPGNAGELTLTRTSGNAALAATVSYTVSGSATAGADYTALPGSVVLPAGQTSVTIPVTVLDDATAEADETVVVTLSAASGYKLGASTQATITIQDDDLAPVVAILSPVGGSAAIPTGVGVRLTGSVVRQAPGGPVNGTAAWTKVSGPGTVTFTDAAAVQTGATFSASGNYVLRLTGTVSGMTATAEASVAVGIPTTTPAAVAADIGVPETAGSWSEKGGVYTVSGAGSGISSSGTSDGFFFLAAPRTGDFDLKCQILSISNPSASGSCRFGIMARANTAPDAVYAMVLHKADGVSGYQYRTTAGGAPGNSTGSTQYTFPRWIRLVRAGNSLSAYYGTDGTAWTQRGSTQTVALGTSPLVGLAITSAVTNEPSTATFGSLNFPLYPNIGPLVDAGPAFNGAGPFALNGTVTDDGLPLPAAIAAQWSKVSGPGIASFANASAINTSVTLNATGSYALRLVADDGQVATFDDTTAVQTATPIETWRTAKFAGNSSNMTIAGDLADPDLDGVTNLLEYALNLNPNDHASQTLPVATSTATELALTYRKNLAATDIAFVVQESTNLTTWTPATVQETIVSDDGQTRVIRASVPASPQNRYLRLKIVH